MPAVTVSTKFQVVIPKSIRDSMELVPGQQVQVVSYRNRIELIPIKPMSRLRGALKGIDVKIQRDRDR